MKREPGCHVRISIIHAKPIVSRSELKSVPVHEARTDAGMQCQNVKCALFFKDELK